MVDVHTGYSAASLIQTREMDEAARQLEVAWINVHGAPSIISGDIEFFNSRFAEALRYFSIQFEPRPARRHNKLGVVERMISVVRVLLQRLLKDASKSSVCVVASVERKEVVSRAVYLSNIFYSSKTLRSFEMAPGYTPSLVGLPQAKQSAEIITAHNE